jgi:hypothetical protein
MIVMKFLVFKPLSGATAKRLKRALRVSKFRIAVGGRPRVAIGLPRATFCGSWRWAAASGDLVGDDLLAMARNPGFT